MTALADEQTFIAIFSTFASWCIADIHTTAKHSFMPLNRAHILPARFKGKAPLAHAHALTHTTVLAQAAHPSIHYGPAGAHISRNNHAAAGQKEKPQVFTWGFGINITVFLWSHSDAERDSRPAFLPSHIPVTHVHAVNMHAEVFPN